MPLVEFVARDGRLTERQLDPRQHDAAAIAALLPRRDLEEKLDGYSPHVRRVQLVELLWSAARRSIARSQALRAIPLFAPIAHAARSVRFAQLCISAALAALVSVGVAPHSGCGVACWAAEALGALYAGTCAVLLCDAALEADDLFAVCRPNAWFSLPPAFLHQLLLTAVAVAALLVHPFLFLLVSLDLLPSIPRCRALLRPLGKASIPVLTIAAIAAMLALPAAAAARAADVAGGCAAGDVAACAAQALAVLTPGGGGGGGGGGDGERRARVDGGGAALWAASQLLPLALLAGGALLLQLGVAVLVDALADERARLLAARTYLADHCVVCGCHRASLDQLAGSHHGGFADHIARAHPPHAYATLLAAAARTPPDERTDDDAWLLECAARGDPAFLPSASRDYWGAAAAGLADGLGGGNGGGGQPTPAPPRGWRPSGWEPGGGAALGWQLSEEPSAAQLKRAVEQLSVDGQRCWAQVRQLARGASDVPNGGGKLSAASLPHGEGGAPADNTRLERGAAASGATPFNAAAWAERLAALERASVQHSEQANEASRVALALQQRLTSSADTATAVSELSRVVMASSATVDRIAAEVDRLKTHATTPSVGGGGSVYQA